MLMGKKASTAVSALALSATLAACGGSSSSGTGASSYMKQVCQGVVKFETSIRARSAALTPKSYPTLASRREALQGFLNGAVSDADQALSTIKGAGTPDVKNGKHVSSALTTAFTQVRGTLSQAASQAQSLPTNNPQAFKTAADSLGTSVRSSMTSIGSSLSGLNSPELETAAKSQASCAQLRSAAGGA